MQSGAVPRAVWAGRPVRWWAAQLPHRGFTPGNWCRGFLPSIQQLQQGQGLLHSASQWPGWPAHGGGSRRRGGQRGGRQLAARAALYTLPEGLQSSINTGTALAVAVALSLSALPILTGEAKERNEEQERVAAAGGGLGADNVRWSVMGVLAFVPFVNPLVRGPAGGWDRRSVLASGAVLWLW